MTAVIHHGNPGSYKTFAIVQRVLIPALQEGRVVATNIRGFNDLEIIKNEFNITLPETAEIIYIDPDKNKVESLATMARWFHWLPEGALIAIDEGQKVYPTRLKTLTGFDYKGDDKNRPVNLENAIDEHRHLNWDIYISTTNVAKIHKEIRQVCEVAYRHRDLSNIIPFSKHKWKEVSHDPENSGKSIVHVISSATYKADKRAFKVYQSTRTGKAKHSTENRSIFNNGRLRFFGILLLFCFAKLVYSAYDYKQKRDLKNNKIETRQMDTEIDNQDINNDSGDAYNNRDHKINHQNDSNVANRFTTKSESDVGVNRISYSDEWQIVGTVRLKNKKSIIVISNGHVTRRVNNRSCQLNRDDYFCLVNGETVTTWTGNRQQRSKSGLNNDLAIFN